MEEIDKLLVEYANDVDSCSANYKLGVAYEEIGQTAAAISFLLRAAEKTTDQLLAYECLLCVGLCFERQGRRGNSVRGAFKHAICLLPKRPEAYFLLSRFYERSGDHVSGYLYAEQGLAVVDEVEDSLGYLVEYPGKYGLLFEKAVCSWWWGKADECRTLFNDLWENHDLSDTYKSSVKANLVRLGIEPRLDIRVKKKETGELFDIVIQGPTHPETSEIIKSYLRLPFVNNIIFSTWSGERTTIIDPTSRVIITKSEKPQQHGTDNKNLQIVSSRNGLNLVKTKYAIKMRSDQLYDSNSMNTMFNFFINDKERDQKLFVAGMYPELLFHPRDHIFWGLTSSLKMMFGCPLEIDGLGDRVTIEKDKLWKYVNLFTRSETYLGAHYISQFDDRLIMMLIKPDLYLWDGCPNWNYSSEISKEVTKKYFKSFPRSGIDLEWKRKGWNNYPYDDQYRSGERWDESLSIDEMRLDLGLNDDHFKKHAAEEVIGNRIYEKFYRVKDNDVVVDIGANVGLFPLSIRDRSPSRVICVEPSVSLVSSLKNNVEKLSFPVEIKNYGIGDQTTVKQISKNDHIYGRDNQETFRTKTFSDFLEESKIHHIDFLKIDCEGYEYDIFQKGNYDFLKNNVSIISGEWHIQTHDLLSKFIEFRDNFLCDVDWKAIEPYTQKPVLSDDMFNNKWLMGYLSFWGESSQLMIYINNEKEKE